jgi:hypothetical protein
MIKKFGMTMLYHESKTKTAIIENIEKPRNYYNKSTKIVFWKNLKKSTMYNWNDKVRYRWFLKIVNVE